MTTMYGAAIACAAFAVFVGFMVASYIDGRRSVLEAGRTDDSGPVALMGVVFLAAAIILAAIETVIIVVRA